MERLFQDDKFKTADIAKMNLKTLQMFEGFWTAVYESAGRNNNEKKFIEAESNLIKIREAMMALKLKETKPYGQREVHNSI